MKNANLASRNVDFTSAKRTVSEEHGIREKCCDGLVAVLKSLFKAAGFRDSETTLIPQKKPPVDPDSATSLEADALSASSDFANDSGIAGDGHLSGVEAVEVFDRKQRVQLEIETGDKQSKNMHVVDLCLFQAF